MIKEGLNKMKKEDRAGKKKKGSDIAKNEIVKIDIESRDLEE